jgi:hypothetical protein
LARTLLRLHAGRSSTGPGRAAPGEACGLEIQVDIAPAHTVRTEREDLDEMLGNLLDNACKWARSRVAIVSAVTDASVAITSTTTAGTWIPRCVKRSCSAASVPTRRRPARGWGWHRPRSGGALRRVDRPERLTSGGLRARLELPG